MTRTKEDYVKALELHAQGLSQNSISKQLNIPRGTIRDWVNGKIDLLNSKALRSNNSISDFIETEEQKQAYAYLFGSFLGDGCISKHARCLRLRIFCDSKQPFVIASNTKAIHTIFTEQTAGVTPSKQTQCTVVSLYSKHLNKLFPQGILPGMKHSKPINLEVWQEDILKGREPYFLLGLFHSDGSFFISHQKKYTIYGYQFTNTSVDIVNLISTALTNLDIRFTIQKQPTAYRTITKNKPPSLCKPRYNISIRRLSEVKKLYKYLGTKYNEIIPELE